MRIYSFLTLLLIVGINVQAQHNLPGKGEVFRDDILPSVYITIPADSLAAILDIIIDLATMNTMLTLFLIMELFVIL